MRWHASDLVAGVVNITTCRSAQGLEVGRARTSGVGLDQNHVTLVGGSGDLDADRYNVLYSFEYLQRDRLDHDECNLTA
jgi:iron complex outermembrane recepter protein